MDRTIVVMAIAASLLLPGAASAAGRRAPDDSGKTTICHVPPGDPDGARTLSVGNAAVRGHLTRHPGDRAGACGPNGCGDGLCDAAGGETPESCVEDCGCACAAAVAVSGLAVDLGTILGVGTAGLTAQVCADCDAGASTMTFSFTPALEIGSTAFTLVADAVGAPQCSLVDDATGLLGTTVVSGRGTIDTGSEQQSTTFTLTLVRVAGLVCSGILVVDSPTLLGVTPSLTIPLSIPCGDVAILTCPAS